jgi:hypothetical protein
MPTFIYCPVLTGEMAAIANSWNAGRVAQGKTPYLVLGAADAGAGKGLRRLFVGGALSSVSAGDKLYILAHGIRSIGDGAVVVGATRGNYVEGRSLTGFVVEGGDSKQYGPKHLASHLEEEGLTKAIVDLRLFCCGSGLAATHNNTAVAPYAARLKAALVGLGYASIMVTGYLGDLDAAREVRFRPGTKDISYDRDKKEMGKGKGVSLPGGGYPTMASQNRVKF